jgi:cytochrome P450
MWHHCLQGRANRSALHVIERHAEELTDDQDRADVVANCVFFIIAGHETTGTLIAAVPICCVSIPPSGLLLRLIQAVGCARVRIDVEVEGERFEAGSRRVMLYAAANHDPRAFPDPDRFDIARPATGHVAFSGGPITALGLRWLVWKPGSDCPRCGRSARSVRPDIDR